MEVEQFSFYLFLLSLSRSTINPSWGGGGGEVVLI